MPSSFAPRIARSVFAVAALTLATTSPVSAQGAAPDAPGAVPGTAVRAYDIAAGALSDSLARIAQQSGRTFTADPALVADKPAPAVRGTMTVEEAFRRALSASGLELTVTGSGTFSARPAPAQSDAPVLPAVRVTDTAEPVPDALPAPYAGGQVARGGQLGLLGNRDFMDTPFNQASYTAELLEVQEVRDLSDVLRNEPSVREFNTATQPTNSYRIRGLRVGLADFTFEGLGGLLVPAMQSVERVEVLKGPSALLNGITLGGSIGGMVNLVPKRAGDRPVTRITTSFETDSLWLGHVDVGRRHGDRQQFGVRFNGVRTDGDTALDEHSRERSDGTLAMDYRGERARVKADVSITSHITKGADSDMFLAAGATVPGAPDAGERYLQPWNRLDANERFAVLRGEYDLTPNVTAFAAVGRAESRFRFNLSYGINLQDSGDFDEVFWGSKSYSDRSSGEVGLNTRFETGSVHHQLAFRVNRNEQESGAVSFFDGTINGTVDPPLANRPNNLYEPGFFDSPDIGTFPSVPKTSELTLTSFALADTLAFAQDRVLLTLGLRQQQVKGDSFNAETGEKSAATYDEEALSPAAGVVIKPWAHVSLFGNYIEGLTRGPVAPATAANAGEVFEPFESRQIELGAKFDLGRWATTISAFDLDQPSSTTDPVTLVFSLDGENRYRGLEFTVFGEPIPGTRVLGGATLLDAELVKTNNGTFDGQTATGAPRWSVNLGGEWDAPFLAGLSFRVLGVYTDSQYVNNANTQELDDWTRVDTGARYAFKAGSYPVTVRTNIENLFDESYWSNTSLYPGAPRTLVVSMTADF